MGFKELLDRRPHHNAGRMAHLETAQKHQPLRCKEEEEPEKETEKEKPLKLEEKPGEHCVLRAKR